MTCRLQSTAPIRVNSGFTLLEVLVSLTIMTLITTVAFAGFSIAINSWERGSKRIQELDRRFAVERLLQRQIGLAYPNDFRGDLHTMEFISSYSLENGSGFPVRVKYSSDGNEFVYSELPVDDYVPGYNSDSVRQRFSGLAPSSIHYLQTDNIGSRIWTDQQVDGLPLAVRVEIAGDVLVIPMVNKQ
jgi:prepilin-type N-terminal cleavage/methylation domain-containing protein